MISNLAPFFQIKLRDIYVDAGAGDEIQGIKKVLLSWLTRLPLTKQMAIMS